MQEYLPILRTNEVFVAGSQPTITYNPRNERHLEGEIRSYVEQRGKALSVSGPTKSGKTVLVERLLPPDRAIWIQGSDIGSIDNFWHAILDGIDAFDQIGQTLDSTTSEGGEGGIQLGLPHAINLQFRRSRTRTSSESNSGSRRRPHPDVVREALRETPYPIVVDDFHYVPAATRRAIARAVKTLITHTHVILVAVPHEAFDVVREEPDMDWRMWGLPIEHWANEELAFIAREGFRALGIRDADEVVSSHLADASYGAPFLMQQLCYDYAVSIEVVAAQPDPIDAVAPPDWDQFFRRVADRAVPGVFEKLTQGPNPRGQQRIDRVLHDGRVTDIYGAILHAIASSGPASSVSATELARILERDLAANPPTRQQIVASIGHLREIARDARGAGDPVLDFKDGVLYMVDPFLSFYLRYSSWELPGSA